MYVISLDQLLSGGLVNSRSMIEDTLQDSYNRIDKILSIIQNKEVVIFDTVMRLASTVGYNGYIINEYNYLRQYASVPRKILIELTLTNIINSYRYNNNNTLITSSILSDDQIDKYLLSRERKLKLTDYYLNKIKDFKKYYTYIGVDDSNSKITIQTNEINYIKKISKWYFICWMR